MKAIIKVRIDRRKKDLETLQIALGELAAEFRAYTHCDGRIREVSNEIEWLEGLIDRPINYEP